jgi:CO dehydrogenase/acetyl-CoA synthase alpha subunit
LYPIVSFYRHNVIQNILNVKYILHRVEEIVYTPFSDPCDVIVDGSCDRNSGERGWDNISESISDGLKIKYVEVPKVFLPIKMEEC